MTKADLPLNLQNSYSVTLNRLGKDEEWGYTALNLKPMSDWIKYGGFGLFNSPTFQAQVATALGKDYAPLTADYVLEQLNNVNKNLTNEIDELRKEVSSLSTTGINTTELDEKIKQVDIHLAEMKQIKESLGELSRNYKESIAKLDADVNSLVAKNINKYMSMLEMTLYEKLRNELSNREVC